MGKRSSAERGAVIAREAMGNKRGQFRDSLRERADEADELFFVAASLCADASFVGAASQAFPDNRPVRVLIEQAAELLVLRASIRGISLDSYDLI